MNGMILDVQIPVAISDVKVACHDHRASDVSCIVSKYSKGRLITVRVNVNDEIDILSIIKVNDVDILVVYEVLPKGEP